MTVNIFSRYNPTFVSIDQGHTFFLFSLATSPSYDRLLLIFGTTGIRISHFIHNNYSISASLLNNFKLCWNWTCQKCSICKQADNSSGEIFQIVNHRRFKNVNKQIVCICKQTVDSEKQRNNWIVILNKWIIQRDFQIVDPRKIQRCKQNSCYIHIGKQTVDTSKDTPKGVTTYKTYVLEKKCKQKKL